MSLPVHLVESLAAASPGSLVEVTGDEAHHAVAVRRLREGERVVLTDGLGASVTGSVAATGKRVFSVTVESVTHDDRPEPTITVVVDAEPYETGFDPYNKLIDRVSADNRKRVSLE